MPLHSRSRRCWNHNAKWWYSTVHITVTIIGAGVIALPEAMTHLNWWPGMLMLGVSWLITMCTMWQIVELHECEGETFDSFADLGKLLGIWGGRELMFTLQMVVQVTANIAYMVTGGYALALFARSMTKSCHLDIFWIPVFGLVQCLLSLVATFSTMTLVNLIGTITAVGYSTIIWGSTLALGSISPDPKYHNSRTFLDQGTAIGVISYAFAGGQNILLDIQASMPSPPNKPSKFPMWNGVLVAYIIVAFCYFPVAAIGYKHFRNLCFDNIFEVLLCNSLEHNVTNKAVHAALFMLVIHLLGSYQIYALPVYEWLEPQVAKLYPTRFTILARPAYVALTCGIAILFPYFNQLLGMIGGLSLAPSCYIMPCVIWLIVKKPTMFSPSWFANVISIVFGLAVLVVSVVGGFGSLVQDLQQHRLGVASFTKPNCTSGQTCPMSKSTVFSNCF